MKNTDHPLKNRVFSKIILITLVFVLFQSLVFANTSLNGTINAEASYSDPVTLTGDTTLNGIFTSFGSSATIDGAHNLIVNITNDSLFGAAIGSITPLNSLDVQGENFAKFSGNINTTGNQSYSSKFLLNNNIQLTGANLLFENDLFGNDFNLTLSPTSGSAVLNNSNIYRLDTFTVEGDLEISGSLDAKNIDIQGNITLNGPLTLSSGEVIPNITSITEVDYRWETINPENSITLNLGKGRGSVVSPDGSLVALNNEMTGVTLWDISDPDSPQNITNTNNPIGWDNVNGVNLLEVWGSVFSPSQNELYLIGDTYAGATDPIRFASYDISDPANPSLLDSLDSTEISSNAYAIRVTPDGKTAAVAMQGSPSDPNIGGLKLIDLSNPNNLSIHSYFTSYEEEGNTIGLDSIEGIALSSDGSTAYLGGQYNNNLTIVDISDPTNPTFSSKLTTSTTIWTIVASADDRYLYLGGSNGISIVDITDKQNPVEINYIDSFTSDSGSQSVATYGLGLSADGLTLLATSYGTDPVSTILSYDVRDPSNPRFGGYLSTDVTEITNSGFYNRVSTTPDGSTILSNTFSFSNPSDPAYFDFYSIPYTVVSPGIISIDGTIDGAYDLNLDSSGGTITLGKTIGGNTPLNSLHIIGTGSTSIGANITTTGDQTYEGSLRLNQGITMTGGNGNFYGAIDANNNNLSLDFTNTVSFKDNNSSNGVNDTPISFSNIADLTIDADGGIRISGNIISTGNQTYNNSVTLGENSTFASGSGSINFNQGIANSNSRSLTLGNSAQTGTIQIGGSNLALNNLSIGDGAFDIRFDTFTLVTSQAQETVFSNQGDVHFNAIHYSSFFGGIDTSGISGTLYTNNGISTFGTDITLGDVVIVNSPYAKIFDTRWTQTIGTPFNGGNITIQNLTNTNSSASNSLYFDLGDGDHSLNFNGTVISSSPIYVRGSGTVNFLGNAQLSGGVYAQDLPGGFTDTTPTMHFNESVTLTGNTEFEGTSATFAKGMDAGGYDLTINFTEQTTDPSAFNNIQNFTAQSAITLAGNFTTTGTQDYNDSLSLTGNTTLSGTTASFAQAIQGGGNDLTLNFTGATSLSQGANNIKDFTSTGALSLGGTFTTTGSQTYGGLLTLLSNTTLSGTNASFGAGLDGSGYKLTLNFSGSYDTSSFTNLSSLEKTGSGTLILDGNNSNSGGISVVSGTLQGDTQSLIGPINNSGILNFQQDFDGTHSSVISGSGSLEKSGTGSVTLSGTNTYSGGTTITAGTLVGSTTSLQGDITNNANLQFNQDSDGTFSSAISGSGSLEKSGTGSVTLSGTNTYSGTTSINGGTLVLDSALTNSDITINSGGTLETAVNLNQLSINQGGRLNLLLSENGVNVGDTNFYGGGILDWSIGNITGLKGTDWSYLNSSDVLNIGATSVTQFTIEANTLSTSNFNPEVKQAQWEIASFTGGIQNFNQGAFNVDSSGMTGAKGRFFVSSENNALFLNYKTGAVWTAANGNWSNTLVWDGATLPENTDNLEFSGAGGTSTNDVDANIHTLNSLVFTSNASGSYTLNGNSISITNEGITNESNHKHTIALDLEFPSNQIINTANSAMDISGIISGAGALEKQGSETLTLTGANSYSGGTTITTGTLAGNTTSLQGDITNNANLQFNQDTDGTFSSAISGSGSLEKSGTGSVTLSGTNTYSGGTTLHAGTLSITNASALGNGKLILEGGTLSLPSADEMNDTNLNFNGDFNWNAGTIAFRDSGLSPEANDLQLNITGDLLNGGNGGQFDFSQIEALDAGDYTLFAFTGSSDFQINDFIVLANSGTELNGSFSLLSNSLIYSITGATSSGIHIQNNGGANTPIISDYTVDRPNVLTINPNNTVKSLSFINNGSLNIETGGQLELSSGIITVAEATTSNIQGGKLFSVTNDFIKQGKGQLNLENNLEVNSDAKVSDGLLSIKGSLNANNLIVENGATLSGNGTAEANVQIYGTLAAGTSPGTLNITGDLTLDSNATTEIEIESTSNYDRTIVSGNIAIDGTLDTSLWGSGSIQIGHLYDIFESTSGTISGEFHTMNAPSLYRVLFNNDGSIASLRFAPNSYTLLAKTQNQLNVAAALDSFISATEGDALTIRSALDGLSQEEYPTAFNQIMPYFYESLSDILLDQSLHQIESIQQHLAYLRNFSSQFDSTNLTDRIGWKTWTQVNRDTLRLNAFDATPAYENKREGFRVGADYRGLDGLQLGLFAGRDFNKVDNIPGSRLDSDSHQLGAYLSKQEANGTFLDATISTSFVDLKTRRSIGFSNIDRSASANTDSLQLNAALTYGTNYKKGNFNYSPHFGVEYSRVQIDGFKEKGADSLSLSLADQTVKRLTGEIGAHFYYSQKINEQLTLLPELRVSGTVDLSDSGRTLHTRLQAGQGAAFDFVPAERDRYGIVTSLGVTALHTDDWSTSIHWNTHTLKRDGISNAILLNLNYKF